MPYTGKYGTATPVRLGGVTGSQQAALAAWLLHLPDQAIAWEHFSLGLIHLAPILGEPEPYREYPSAEFELMLVALQREPRPDANDPTHTFAHMEPVNYVAQFHGVTDAQAREICALMGRAFCDGYLPAEPRTTELQMPPRRPGGLVVPTDRPTLNIGANEKIVEWGGLRLSARAMFKQAIRNTVEHIRMGGHAQPAGGEHHD